MTLLIWATDGTDYGTIGAYGIKLDMVFFSFMEQSKWWNGLLIAGGIITMGTTASANTFCSLFIISLKPPLLMLYCSFVFIWLGVDLFLLHLGFSGGSRNIQLYGSFPRFGQMHVSGFLEVRRQLFCHLLRFYFKKLFLLLLLILRFTALPLTYQHFTLTLGCPMRLVFRILVAVQERIFSVLYSRSIWEVEWWIHETSPNVGGFCL
jgi:hypothetical protein